MHSELSNLSLFAHCIARVALLTGLGPAAILCAILARCPFPFCVLRDWHDEGHDVRVLIERFIPYREQAELFKSSGGGQLAQTRIVIPASRSSRATSPPRKVRSA
jgi:hypothetical protein